MKSIEVKFNEAIDELRKKNKLNKFREVCPIGSTIEAQLNCALAVLDGTVQQQEAARRTIRKHNGAADNEHFTESAGGWSEYSEATDHRELQVKSYMLHGISEADARKVLNLPPKEVAVLGKHAVVEYTHARRMGFNEADATKLAKQRGSFMESLR